MESEFTANLFYLLGTVYCHSYLFYFPLLIQTVMGLLPLLLKFPFLPNSLILIIKDIQGQRRDVILMKHKVEFLLFVYMLVSTLFLFNLQFFNILLYFQFLTLKNKFNPLILVSNSEMDSYVNTKIINNNRIFSLTKKMVNFCYFKLTHFIRKA